MDRKFLGMPVTLTALMSAVLVFGLVGTGAAEIRIPKGPHGCVNMHIAAIKDLGFNEPATLMEITDKFWSNDKCLKLRPGKNDSGGQGRVEIQAAKKQITGVVTRRPLSPPENVYKTNTVVMYATSRIFNSAEKTNLLTLNSAGTKGICLDVGVYSIRELGFRKSAPIAKVLARAKRRVIKTCPGGGSRKMEYTVYPPVGPNEPYKLDTVVGVSLINLYGGMGYLMAN